MNDVFGGDAFKLDTLTAAINELPYVPSMPFIDSLFEEDGVSTLDVSIEFEKGTISIIPAIPRGSPAKEVIQDRRKLYSFRVPHLKEHGNVLADSVQGVRDFGTQTNTQTVERQRDKLLAKMRRQIDYTILAHRIAAIKGSFFDANGGQTNLHTLFGTTQQSVNFVLATQTTKIRTKVGDVLKLIEDALGGSSFTSVNALCGQAFWDAFVEHDYVRETYKVSQDGAALRNDPRLSVTFGGATFWRFRGTSDVNIPTNEAIFIPSGVPELFLTRYAPADYMETVNTNGVPYYAKAKPMDYDRGVDMEAQSNPLNICTRPLAIVKGTVAA